MKNIRLGDVLIEFGYITPDQLNTALAYQKEHRDLRVGQALQELGYVNERQVLEALAQRLQLKMIDIEHTNVDVTAVEKVPQELAQKYDMLPIAQSPRALTIAANDPLNYYALEDIRQLTGLEPEIVLAELEPLRRAIRYYYAEVSARKAARTANDSDMAAAQTEDLAIDMTAEGGDLDAPRAACRHDDGVGYSHRAVRGRDEGPYAHRRRHYRLCDAAACFAPAADRAYQNHVEP